MILEFKLDDQRVTMPRLRAAVKYGSLILLCACFGVMIMFHNPGLEKKKLDNIFIPDLQVNHGNTIRISPRNIIHIQSHESEKRQNPGGSFDFNHMDIWDTSSLDEVLPDKYVTITGTRRPNKVFLTIGIPSIKRKDGAGRTYLLETLKSLTSNCSPDDRDRVNILIFLADFDTAYKKDLKSQIRIHFESYLKSGYIQIMEVDKKAYPQLENLKQNFKDTKVRVTWRSKQVIDFAYMFHFAQNLSDYYLQLEDDVISSPNYIKDIQNFINAQTKPWAILQFSVLGFIGKLFKSRDLEQFAKFLKLFYQEMPVDWLYPIFAKLLSYPTVPIRKPTLFQHMGKVSSLRLNEKQKLKAPKDKFFNKAGLITSHLGKPSNPPASFYSSISPYKFSVPSNVYIPVFFDKKKFFRGQEPALNDTFTVVFHKSHRLKAIQIETGHPDKGNDFLRSADLLIGTATNTVQGAEDLCDGQYKVLDALSGGSLLKTDIDKTVSEPIDCIRLIVTGAQVDWVIINTVNVWTIS